MKMGCRHVPVFNMGSRHFVRLETVNVNKWSENQWNAGDWSVKVTDSIKVI